LATLAVFAKRHQSRIMYLQSLRSLKLVSNRFFSTRPFVAIDTQK
jgi:hypothetical protein